jgi:hypothetical protein
MARRTWGGNRTGRGGSLRFDRAIDPGTMRRVIAAPTTHQALHLNGSSSGGWRRPRCAFLAPCSQRPLGWTKNFRAKPPGRSPPSTVCKDRDRHYIQISCRIRINVYLLARLLAKMPMRPMTCVVRRLTAGRSRQAQRRLGHTRLGPKRFTLPLARPIWRRRGPGLMYSHRSSVHRHGKR